MERFFKSLLFAFLFFLMSCQEGGEAGDLWGQWRMTGSDDKYLSFSGSVALFRNITKREVNVYGNFQHIGDSLFIQCYSNGGWVTDTVMVEETFGFKPFNNIRVKIETLNDDDLVLSKDSLIWSFYKY